MYVDAVEKILEDVRWVGKVASFSAKGVKSELVVLIAHLSGFTLTNNWLSRIDSTPRYRYLRRPCYQYFIKI